MDFSQDIEQKKKKKKSGGFQSMNLIPQVFKAVMAKGYNVPTPVQRKAIPFILEGRDVVISSRTGSGKTAAFIIPMLNKLKSHAKIVGTRALIICPTRELALQTHNVIKQFIKFTDLVVTLIIGGHGFEGQFESLATNPDIIIATPGRLMQHFKETGLTLTKVEMLIFDEADFLFELGFKEQLGIIINKVGSNHQTLLFSATIPEELSNFAKVGLKDYIFVRLDNEYSLSEEIELHFLISKPTEKFANLLYILNNIVQKEESVMIFTCTKYHVDFITETLEKYNIKSVGIYGKMSQTQRRDNFYEFKTGKVKILVVTDLASRGLDVPSVNYVLQYDFPPRQKIFIHRSGRTARAGRSGKTISIVATNEVMYILDLLLFIGRKLTPNLEKENAGKYAFYGQIPFDLLSPYVETFLEKIKDSEIFKAYDTSLKAFSQFIKTRPSASRASLLQSKAIDFNVCFPLVQNNPQFQQTQDVQKFMEDLKNFKPKEAFLDLKNQGKLKSGERNEEYMQVLKKIKKQQENFAKQKEHKKENQELIDKDEAQRTNYIMSYQNDDETKNLKRKRSQLSDFRDPKFFINYEPKIGKTQNQFIEDGKINQDDINTHIIAEDLEDVLKSKKNYIWDKTKKKFIIGKLNDKGTVEKQKSNSKDKKGKFLFDKWSKNNQMKKQKDGEVEDTNMVERAQNLFKNKGKYKHNKGSAPKIRNVRREVKDSKQIMKSKKIQKNNKFRNMDKTKKKRIITKNKGAKLPSLQKNNKQYSQKMKNKRK